LVQINFALREVSCKIVYYGPGLSGKTTNLEIVHQKVPSKHKGKLTSLATEGDRTLFFDFLPLDLGTIGGLTTKFQLYTVPGQVYYNATRKLVLRGADGIVFVADSNPLKMAENIESLENLGKNLKENGLDINTIPIVFQWNKRDLENAVPVAELEKNLNKLGAPSFEAVAIRGEGVFPTLKALAGLVLESVDAKSLAADQVRKPAAPKPEQPAAPPTEQITAPPTEQITAPPTEQITPPSPQQPAAAVPGQPPAAPVPPAPAAVPSTPETPLRIAQPPQPAAPQPPPAAPAPVPPQQGYAPFPQTPPVAPQPGQPPQPAQPWRPGTSFQPYTVPGKGKDTDTIINTVFIVAIVAIVAVIIYFLFFR